MRRIIHRLAEEWERAVLWCAVLALAGLAAVCWRVVPATGDRLPTPAAAQRGAILGPDAYAFLAPGPATNPGPDGAAFAFGFRPPAPPVPIGDQQKGTGKQPPEQEAATAQGPDGKGQDVKRDPPPPLPRQLRYLGIYVSTVGERLAAIEVRDPATGRVQTAFRRHGQTCEGLRLDAFDGDSVHLLAPSGTRTRVWRGAERTFQIPPTVPQPE